MGNKEQYRQVVDDALSSKEFIEALHQLTQEFADGKWGDDVNTPSAVLTRLISSFITKTTSLIVLKTEVPEIHSVFTDGVLRIYGALRVSRYHLDEMIVVEFDRSYDLTIAVSDTFSTGLVEKQAKAIIEDIVLQRREVILAAYKGESQIPWRVELTPHERVQRAFSFALGVHFGGAARSIGYSCFNGADYQVGISDGVDITVVGWLTFHFDAPPSVSVPYVAKFPFAVEGEEA